MKRYRISDIPDIHRGHFLKNLIPGKYISRGSLMWGIPGERHHTNDGPDGIDYHVHEDEEVFVVLQGKGFMELGNEKHELHTGDILIVQQGEDHHLNVDKKDPCVVLWLHASDKRPG